jgi:hypothetical protein
MKKSADSAFVSKKMLTFAPCYYYEILHCRVAVQNVDALYRQSQADVVIVDILMVVMQHK